MSEQTFPKPVDPFAEDRNRMVIDQIARRGVTDARVLDAMRRVAREAFVPEGLRGEAYADGPLPIGEGQTISQPYIVAVMAEALALRGDETVLEVGTGSGYAAAVLAHLAREIHTIERIASLAQRARSTLASLGYYRVHVIEGDGTLGWPQAAPYDAIVVTAAGPRVPDALLAQLKPGGRIVMPVGPVSSEQKLVRLTRSASDGYEVEDLGPVRFVPLIGADDSRQAEREKT